MKRIFLLITFFISFLNSYSQSPADFLWSKTMGGSGFESYGYEVFDKAAIALSVDEKSLYVGTSSSSNDGFVNDSLGSLDCWLIKLDTQTGDTLWTKVFGGSGYEEITDVTETADGGCIVCGFSNSMDGDFENKGLHLSLTMPDYIYSDGFIAKFSAKGEIEWLKYYGGRPFIEETSVGIDKLYKIITTKDGGYMAAGYTYSNTDDIPVDLERFIGGWLLKVDKNGKIIHSDKFTGKNHNESNPNTLVDIIETEENVFYAVGSQSYIIVGDGTIEFQDYIWVIKTDGVKIIEEKEYGNNVGSSYPAGLTVTESGKILVVATAQAARGDVSQIYGSYDIWLLKLGQNLEIDEERNLGGTAGEYPFSIVSDKNGHYMICAYTNSEDYDAGTGVGASDFWAINLNENMDTLQTYRMGGTALDRLTDAVFSEKGDKLYVTGRTESADGIIEASFGNGDIWVSAINQNETISVENISTGNSIVSIYPNPSNGVFYLTNSKNSTFSISDITGKTIKTGKIDSDSKKIDVLTFGKGVYFIEVVSETQKKSSEIKKIIIN